ncbi:hypothetical protein OROMI_007845 [Orobanche minor]
MTLALQLDNEFQYAGWGTKRWASARRGGMTILGKVAVPKPLNLPSQRLENHGLDPNVEIVPKGTLSWGSRPSSSGSNPWISSSLSPNAESGIVSPSHVSGRPSSGGSGTRPSTAGSERSNEPVANTWGSSSRPSSASEILSSNQAPSPSLRPRSAENRPNSSQLSRFADPVSKSSAAWGSSGAAERLGIKSSKEDGFSLSSGDFPTLGTEKDNLMKNTECEDYIRPSSASGRVPHGKEDTGPQSDARHGTVNTWRADGPLGAQDDIPHPSMEKWHGDPQQYFNPNAAQHFDAWRGPHPVSATGPAGVWYGGQHPRGPPFGAPVRPGGFPMEPFPYYHPQVAPPPFAGSQPGPPPGPRAPHLKNGDIYRPQMPDAYARPSMPYRPGFYPGPPGPHGPMAFEGYYGPPMGYERDIPYMSMPAGPPVYNSSCAGPALDIGNSHGANGRGHHTGKTSSEQVEAEDIEGPKRITLKSRNQSDHQRKVGDSWEHNVKPDVLYPEKNHLPIIPYRKNEWGAEEDTEDDMYAKRRTPSEECEYRGPLADGMKVQLFDRMGNVKAVNDNWTNLSGSVPSFPQEMPRPQHCSSKDSSLPTAMKNPTLMQKIDVLNAKMRGSDGRSDSHSAYNREDERTMSQIIDTEISNNTEEVSNTVWSSERAPAYRNFCSVPQEVIVPVSDKPAQPVVAVSRRAYGGQGRVDHRGKGKFNSQDTDGWRKRPLTAESSSAVRAPYNGSSPRSDAHGPNNVEVSFESSVINPVGYGEGGSVETHDSSDIQAQHAKMRQIAKQRALQLQKEEEERTREQRAKALAKLEELNRRTLAGETGSEKSEKSQVINNILEEQDESHTVDEPVMADHNNVNQAGESVEMFRNLPVMADHNNVNQAGESVEMFRNLPVGSVMSALPVHEEDAHDASDGNIASYQFSDSRHRRSGYKHKQNSSFQKSFSEKAVSNFAPNAHNDHTHVATHDIKPHEHPSSKIISSESNLANTSNIVVGPPTSQRRKNNKSGKNKHRMDETPLPPVESNPNLQKEPTENIEVKDSLSSWESAFSTVNEPDKTVQAQEVLCPSLPNEESHNRAPNQWRPHPPRTLPRNQQANNTKPHGGDNTVWAPVRMQNKAKGWVEASPNAVHESTNSTKTNNNTAQNSSKGKRAEMERYVPKPVAKELAQQINVPNPSSSIISSRSNDGSNGEVNEEDLNHNKQKKDQGIWKQHGPSDSSYMKSAHIGPSLTSETPKEIQEPKEIGQSMKNEIGSVNSEIKTSSNTAAMSKYPLVKDQGATGRGKRNGPKGPVASIRNNIEPEKTFSGAVDMNQMDRTKERTWQPKSSSNTYTENNQHGNRTESLTRETNRFPKKEHPPQPKVQFGSFSQTQPGQSFDVGSNVAVEFEKKAEGRPYSLNQDNPLAPSDFPTAANENIHIERHVPSGSRRNNRQSHRPVRGHDNNNRGDWTSSGHEDRPHNAPQFRDNRHRQNLHYEYQPVGPFKGNRPERIYEPNDGAADSMDQRHVERRQSHSRRGGNSNRRQNVDPAPVEHGWE